MIVSPALAAANNGNWQTAWRWSRMLRPDFNTVIAKQWAGEDVDVLLALHARRSAQSVAAWARAKGSKGLAVVLTGTDLYRDIHSDASAQQSLELAGRLVVLHELAPTALPARLRAKTTVLFQSAPPRRALTKTSRHLRALMVGHLRDEKDPLTYVRAARRLGCAADIYLDHIGDALDDALGQACAAASVELPHYRWLGGLPHAVTRARIQRAHVLVHASKMEGGAHVILEAVQSGTPVLASRIDGNVGMLGAGYAGYFALGDDVALSALLQRCRDDCDFLPRLRQQCLARSAQFDPGRERSLLLQLVSALTADASAPDSPLTNCHGKSNEPSH
ncbi:selenoneine biosynthesis selenosugar synthase SenB [Rhodoferax sp.]|uniref:selenoneine biosynthesis selenosugar synthase SenB n=1 Tax=Rhodoferax sp. TaxID=50421 RepID=UPI00276DB6D5|nr:selenoneine biosynthesis selenosugar synthase SenB [Rhodoferax sp.]